MALRGSETSPELKQRLEQELARRLPPGAKLERRIFDYYLSVFSWCLEQAREIRAVRPGAVILGVNGPQGAGKTTLTHCLVPLFSQIGWHAVSVSIDDFYLTHAAQVELAAQYPTNSYLQQRGYPGTHDVALAAATIEELRELGAGDVAAVPVYDKALHEGRGDRLPPAAWRQINGPVDIVLFEGWMLGFPPVDAARLGGDPALAVVNRLLAAYEPWRAALDAMVQLRMADVQFVVRWRVEAEAALRREGRGALSSAAARAYVEQFLPAYAVYPAALECHPPCPGRHLVICLGEDRLPKATRGE